MGKQRAATATAVAKNEKYQKLNPEAKAAIVAQLRSGNYRKSTSASYYTDQDGEEYFNVVGVIKNTYALTQGLSERSRQYLLTKLPSDRTFAKIAKWLGVSTDTVHILGMLTIGYRTDGSPVYLIDVNDGYDTRILSFAKIADLIEKRL